MSSRTAVPRALRRTQPPTVATVSARAFRQGVQALVAGEGARARLRERLSRRFGAQHVALTDSGTSALLLAFRAARLEHRTVAMPAYSCPDLLAAAISAGVRVRLYDTDPVSLSPDMDSVAAALDRGAAAIVIAHLYGYPADILEARKLASNLGVMVIEDAAQAAGGSLNNRLLGSFGPLSVLSFGRGKGMSGSGGGALLWTSAADDAQVASPDDAIALASGAGPAGWAALVAAAAQWALARPRLYGIPSALPMFALGETRYHAAHDPTPIAGASAALAAEAAQRADDEARARARTAKQLLAEIGKTGAAGIVEVAGARPGYLRLPVRFPGARPDPALGILAGYPATLADYEISSTVLEPGERAGPGAIELRDSLFTVPTHHFVRDGDIARVAGWFRGPDA